MDAPDLAILRRDLSLAIGELYKVGERLADLGSVIDRELDALKERRDAEAVKGEDLLAEARKVWAELQEEDS